VIERVFRSRRVVTPAGVGPASVHVEAGRIVAVAAWDALPAGTPVVDAGDAVIGPGVVDTHVHVNEPGRTDWEGFVTATRAAAAGGTTTLVDMPLNSIPATTTAAALAEKRGVAGGHVFVDVGFWGGVVPGNAGELAGLVAGGALGCKCFLVDSGVDEFPPVGRADLEPALAELRRLAVPLLVHAELAGPIDAAGAALAGADPRRYATYLASRPPAAEAEAIALMVSLVRRVPARVHIVHHSAAAALPLLRAARADGLPISAETCPHYLTFAAEDIPDGATPWKCAPPIRERENRELLWRALAEGDLDLVASDHSPCPPAMKGVERGDFGAAWGGISGLQLALAATWTEARRRGFGLADLARWMSAAPARLAGLDDKKGTIAPGRDADLVIWRPEERFRVERVEHRHPLTPWAGRELDGVVESTWLRGDKVFDRGDITGPVGALL
jgi:allantoinase